MSIDRDALNSLRIDRPQHETQRRWAPWLAGGAVLLAIAVVAGWALTRQRGAEVTVSIAKPVTSQTRGAVLNASGYVTARRQATVSAKITGKITDVFIEEGMVVRRGQELARLDDSYASRGLRLAEAEAAAAASALNETSVRIREAEIDFGRAERLSTQQISSRSDLDRAQAQVDALRARLASQRDSLGVARRQVELQRQNVEDTIIRAPFDGVVVSKDAQPGEMISPVSAGGGFTRTGVCTIVDMDSLEIEVDVNEAYINRVQPGQKVDAVLDAYPDWKIPAHVITPVPTANREKATVRVRIAFDQKDARILPDMGVKVAFITHETATTTATAGVEVPRGAIRRDGERDVLFVVSDGKVERRAVQVGAASGETIRIESGVSAGEQVVVGAPDELADGSAVRVKNQQ